MWCGPVRAMCRCRRATERSIRPDQDDDERRGGQRNRLGADTRDAVGSSITRYDFDHANSKRTQEPKFPRTILAVEPSAFRTRI